MVVKLKIGVDVMDLLLRQSLVPPVVVLRGPFGALLNIILAKVLTCALIIVFLPLLVVFHLHDRCVRVLTNQLNVFDTNYKMTEIE